MLHVELPRRDEDFPSRGWGSTEFSRYHLGDYRQLLKSKAHRCIRTGAAGNRTNLLRGKSLVQIQKVERRIRRWAVLVEIPASERACCFDFPSAGSRTSEPPSVRNVCAFSKSRLFSPILWQARSGISAKRCWTRTRREF
jgi:hypothetical protein